MDFLKEQLLENPKMIQQMVKDELVTINTTKPSKLNDQDEPEIFVDPTRKFEKIMEETKYEEAFKEIKDDYQ